MSKKKNEWDPSKTIREWDPENIDWEDTTICALCGQADCICDIQECPCEIPAPDCEWPSDDCPCPICNELMKNCKCSIIKKQE